MLQVQKVIQAIQDGKKSIADITAYTSILRPNIRRILGQGAKKGIFKRLDKGVYTLSTADGQERAYIHTGAAQNILPQLTAAGHKFDMVFLDPAYYSRGLAFGNNSGNRKIRHYDYMSTADFADMMQAVSSLLRTDDSHVYLMLSGAKTTQQDMQKYLFAALESGLQYVAEGKYTKTYKNGQPVKNLRGVVADPERLILLTKSGRTRAGDVPGITLDFEAQRPPIRTSYSTEKAPEVLERLILQSTHENDVCLDPGAGSGIFGEVAITLNRIVHLVEIVEDTITNFILPKFLKFC